MNARIIELNKSADTAGRCVLYIMARDQRVNDNHALLEAQAEAMEHALPLIVGFNLLPSSGFRSREHYEFMVAGLKEVEKQLKTKNIPFVVTIGDMKQNIRKLLSEFQPRSLYFDFSPLRGPRAAQKSIAHAAACRVAVVDTHNIVPVWVTSDKEEFAAHTIRRKLHRLVDEWALEPSNLKQHPHSISKLPRFATREEIQRTVKAVPASGIQHEFAPGEAAASRALQAFVQTGITNYAEGRNDALADAQSNLSPYLHYGQLSSLRIVLAVTTAFAHPPQLFTSFKMPSHDGPATVNDGIDSFIEELVVRKELSDNFCFYNPHYDSIEGAKDWSKKTLADHAADPREFVYSKQQLEAAETHDELWNAAQRQLTRSGKIHGYMRMYWAKKLLEWTESPEAAVKIAVELNDRYHLDGGDPNGYVGILWSIAGLHDRPWFNRSVYGTVRYMARSGADKKFDTRAYIACWAG